jgi:predicted acetyltransferase
MPQLMAPTTRVHFSFLAAMAEYRDEGRGKPDDKTLVGRDIREYGDRWADPAQFAVYIGWLRADALEGAPRPTGQVPATNLWWTEGNEYLGRLSIRHWLTSRLLTIGGHIGYDVRPTARRRGHATAMLAAALPMAHELGIDPALVMCDVANIGSRKVIEANGGVFRDERAGKLRYWAPTSGPA